jgi:hypothetical protein
MVRQNLQPDASYYAVYLDMQQDGTLLVSVENRSTQGIVSRQVIGMNNAVTTPVYLEITSTGNTISAYTSQDGTNWTLVNGSTVPLDPTKDAPGLTLTMDTNSALAGMVISPHDPVASVSATLDEVKVG